MQNIYSKESYVEQKLADTLIELLRNKELQDISVRELCDKAGVGRASFYRHFQNKEDILDRHARSLIKEWTKEFESSPNTKPWEVFQSLFCHIKKYQTFYEVLHKTGRDTILRTSLREKIGWTKNLSNADAYQKIFFADGISGWIEEWIERGMKESPDKLDQMLQHYFTNILSHLDDLYIQ